MPSIKHAKHSKENTFNSLSNRSSSLIDEPKNSYGITRDPRITKKYY